MGRRCLPCQPLLSIMSVPTTYYPEPQTQPRTVPSLVAWSSGCAVCAGCRESQLAQGRRLRRCAGPATLRSAQWASTMTSSSRMPVRRNTTRIFTCRRMVTNAARHRYFIAFLSLAGPYKAFAIQLADLLGGNDSKHWRGIGLSPSLTSTPSSLETVRTRHAVTGTSRPCYANEGCWPQCACHVCLRRS